MALERALGYQMPLGLLFLKALAVCFAIWLTGMTVWPAAFAQAEMRQSSTDAKALSALLSGEHRELIAALKSGANPDATDAEGYPMLQRAILLNDGNAFSSLLDAGASPSKTENVSGRNAVHWAAMHEDSWWMETLIARKADLNAPNSLSQQRPLMDAIQTHRENNIRLMLKAGVDVNARNASGDTSLHVAALTNLAHYSLMLLEAGADPRAKNNMGHTFQAYQWMGQEDLLNASIRKSRQKIRAWLRAHSIAIEDMP